MKYQLSPTYLFCEISANKNIKEYKSRNSIDEEWPKETKLTAVYTQSETTN